MIKVYMEIAPVPAIMPAPAPAPAPAPESNGYLKWAIAVFILIVIVLMLRPYYPLFIKLFDLTKMSMEKPPEATIGPKLEINKEEVPPPEPEMEYCYVGEWKGIRNCVRVDSSQCSSQSYSTESQCVNPSLR